MHKSMYSKYNYILNDYVPSITHFLSKTLPFVNSSGIYIPEVNLILYEIT
jgi:hypothetical protein